jgi:hypothetical protein
VLVGSEAEVLDGLTGVLGAAEQQGVGTGGLLKSELVKGLGLAAGSLNTSAGGGGEAESSDIGLGDLEEAVVIGDGADNNDGLLLVAVLEVGGNAGEGDGRAVDAAHEQAAEHDLVEGRVGAAGQEAVKLHQELEVHIVALGGLAVRRPLVVLAEIDTCVGEGTQSAFGSGMLKLASSARPGGRSHSDARLISLALVREVKENAGAAHALLLAGSPREKNAMVRRFDPYFRNLVHSHTCRLLCERPC